MNLVMVSTWSFGEVSPLFIVLKEMWVAPSAFHAFTLSTQSSGEPSPADTQPSRPISDIFLPFSSASSRSLSIRDRAVSSGCPVRIQPSPVVAMRLIVASALPPSQTWIGLCTGSGLMPASVIVCHLPLNVTSSSVYSFLMRSICSSERRPLSWKFSFNASYSTGFQPIPMPSLSLPPHSTSRAAACLATSTVCL